MLCHDMSRFGLLSLAMSYSVALVLASEGEACPRRRGLTISWRGPANHSQMHDTPPAGVKRPDEEVHDDALAALRGTKGPRRVCQTAVVLVTPPIG